jgi:cellulose synthase/poly-beta-1,6-N-acetylglucosamine synthase-like glycosyltransferase
LLWYWIFAGPALALALLSLRGERSRAAYVARRLSQAATDLPPATVIVPVKGRDHGLLENLAALAALDYPDYELLIVARSASDIPPGVLPRRARVVLAHNDDPTTGEKVRNLAAAVRVARHRTRIFAFADSDVCVPPRWLRALVAPLAGPGVGASTGYRWFAPEPAAFWSLVRSVWDAVVFGILGPGDNPFAWGGSMAILKETFYAAHVLEHWKNAVSDDFTLSAAVHASRLRIAFAPGALAPCFDTIAARPLFSWMRRQTTLTRVHDRRLWLAALAAHILYCAGMAASLAAAIAGSRLAACALLAQLAPGMFKGWNRAAQAKAALPGQAAWFRRHAWAHVLLVPLVTWIWLVALVSSTFGNTIEWRGYRYKLK